MEGRKVYIYNIHVNNYVHRAPFSDIHVERKKEVAKSKERQLTTNDKRCD